MDFKQDLLIIDDAEISDTETPEENGQEAAGLSLDLRTAESRVAG